MTAPEPCSARRSTSTRIAPRDSCGSPGPVGQDAHFHWTDSPDDALAHSDELARCALAVDDGFAECHALLGAIYLTKMGFEEAVAHGTRAIELEPNAADATATPVELLKRAMRLSPIPSAWYLAVLAHAYRLLQRYDEAIDVYKQAIALAPNQIAAHLGLTICYAQAGQEELARLQGRDLVRRFAADRTHSLARGSVPRRRPWGRRRPRP